MEPVRSTRNRKVVETARLHRVRERHARGLTILEGPHLIAAALGAGVEPERVFVLEGADLPAVEGELIVVDEKVMNRLAGTETPSGPVAVIPIPASDRPRGRSALVAWGMGDPGNLGTLIRTAAAFGYPVVVGPDTVDPWSPKVLRSGAGGHFHTPVTKTDDLNNLDDLKLLATVVSGGASPEELDEGPWAILVGSEPHGLPTAVIDRCTTVTIPMATSTESLNAAVAGGIVAYLLASR